MTCRPGHAPKHPDFPAGNEMSMRHGAWSPRKVDPLAAELVAGLLAERPDLGRYPETVWAWARAEARCALIAEWHAEVGMIDRKAGTVRGGSHVASFERVAADARARLGLDPSSEAQLARDRAEAARSSVDLDALRREGRAIIEARAAAGTLPAVGEPAESANGPETAVQGPENGS